MGFTPPIDAANTHDALALLPGYGPGAQILTDMGEIPVEWLATGDKVLTLDHGLQPVLWIGRVRFSSEALETRPAFTPCKVDQGALGFGRPSAATVLAPHTRMLLCGWEVALNTGTDEALAEVGALADGDTVIRPPFAPGLVYTYLLLPAHEVVQVNGLWAETLLLDPAARAALAGFLPESLVSLSDLSARHAQSARLCLSGWEVAAILGGNAKTALRVIDRVA